MSKTNYDYIQFANYKDIPNWSVQYVVEEQLGFTKKYPMAKIGSFLKRSKNLVEIQDNVEYKRVSISTIGKGGNGSRYKKRNKYRNQKAVYYTERSVLSFKN